MKISAFLLSAAFLLSPALVRAGEELAVVAMGKPQDPVAAYRAESKLYIDAKRVGELYGGQVYWYPVSGRVKLSLRGRSLNFVVDSSKASTDDGELELGGPMIVRASRAFICCACAGRPAKAVAAIKAPIRNMPTPKSETRSS